MALWTTRLAESLAPEHRRPASFASVVQAARIVVTNRQTVLMTLAMTTLYGSFTSYLSSSELIISDVFGQGDRFAVIFGGVALFMGGAMLINARIVQRVGTRRLGNVAMLGYLAAAVAMVAISVAYQGVPPLWLYLIPLTAALAGHALLIPNLNALAMAPMGHVAGMASALTGAFQIAVGAMLGAVIDQLFDGTVAPLSWSFLIIGVVAYALIRLDGRATDGGGVAPAPDRQGTQAQPVRPDLGLSSRPPHASQKFGVRQLLQMLHRYDLVPEDLR